MADLMSVLNAGSFNELNRALEQCRLEDILLYQIGERFKFANGFPPLKMNQFENLMFSELYLKEDRTDYIRDVLKDFLKYKLTPKREVLQHRMNWHNQCILGGSAVGAAAMMAGAFAVPQPYLPFLAAAGLGMVAVEYFYFRRRKRIAKAEAEADRQITMKDIALFKAVKSFDCEQFFAKNEDCLKGVIRKYWDDYHKTKNIPLL